MAGNSAADVDGDTDRAELRHQLAHDFASPIRGLGILADLLAETLDREPVDLEVIGELSDQLSRLSIDVNERLTAFAKADD